MTKKLFTVLAILLITTSVPVNASAILPGTAPDKSTVDIPFIEIGYGVQVPAIMMATLTPKQYRQLTGHRLGIVRSIALKIAQKKMIRENDNNGTKSQVVAALLCFFLGTLGIHRFYLGYTGAGIAQLLTAGGLGIWALIDFIRILTGDLQPKHGEYRHK